MTREPEDEGHRPAQPALIRLTHWVNLIALAVMAGSGLRILVAYPFLGPQGGPYGWYPLQGVNPPAASPARSPLVAAAVAGALAGDAALQVTCAAHAYAPHLLAFHVGGVLLAAAVASAITRLPRTAHA